MVLVQSILTSGTLTFHSIDEESHVKRVGRPWKKITSRYNPEIYGSCNGLLLLNIDYDLFLWNPVALYFKKVLSYNPLAIVGFRVVSGLCYDSSTNEYKALIALSHESPSYGCERAVVGSFKSKNWRRIRFPYKVYMVKSGPVVNERLHWYVSKGNSGHFLSSHGIIYFNSLTNKFSKVPMPEPMHGADGEMIFGLGVLNGCLSMVRHDNPSNSEAYSVEVLAMKEYGMQNSWTMLFIISNLSLRFYDKVEPLCYTKDGEALMKISMTGSGENVRAYNRIDSSYKEILVQPKCNRVDAIMYEESFVTPTGCDWEEEERRGEPTYTAYCGNEPLYRCTRRWDGSWEYSWIEEEDNEQANSEESESDIVSDVDLIACSYMDKYERLRANW